MIVIALAAATIAPAAQQASPQQASPQQAAGAFYSAYLRTRPGGVPGPRERARLRPLLSPRLDLMLERAARAEEIHWRRTGGREPPLIEGDVFTSLFEGAGRFQVERCRAGASRAICNVRLGHDEPGRRPARWSDQLVLVGDPSGWRVDDVVYGATWDFGNKGRLSQTLRGAISGR